MAQQCVATAARPEARLAPHPHRAGASLTTGPRRPEAALGLPAKCLVPEGNKDSQTQGGESQMGACQIQG